MTVTSETDTLRDVTIDCFGGDILMVMSAKMNSAGSAHPETGNSKEILRELIEGCCLKIGNFTLSTGIQSDFYFDCKQVTLDGEGLSLVSAAFLKRIKEFKTTPTAIGGLTMGADFIVAGVIQKAFEARFGITNRLYRA